VLIQATASSAAAYLPPALQDIQAAVAKAAKLRALHAALLHDGACASRSPAIIRLPRAVSLTSVIRVLVPFQLRL
jgi:hypothetical protein